MKKTLLSFLMVATAISLNLSVTAQTIFPVKDSPRNMTPEYALEQTKTYLPTCGFSSAYIQTSDLQELMKVKNCVGIRFYVSMENPKQRFAAVIAVAIKSNGQEIGDFLERKYHLARPLDDHYPDEFVKMNLSSAKKCVYYLRDGVAGLTPYAAYLGVESINALLNTPGATGIRIYSSGYDTLRTMAFGAVKYENKEVKDVGGNYLQSSLPCPVDCGGDPYILWNR
ncbi:MAG: hypothetical protein K9J17_14635 [Flavobacteriales bacterium]|nr:hypothetical protein [Flavobacteriales bacterium]